MQDNAKVLVRFGVYVTAQGGVRSGVSNHADFRYLQERAEKFFQILFKNFKFQLNYCAIRIGTAMSKLISEMRREIVSTAPKRC